MNFRFAVTMTLGAHAACMSGCILFEDRNRPCEVTSTCEPPPASWIEAGAHRDAAVDVSVESTRVDAGVDAGIDGAVSYDADAGDDTTRIGPLGDATASDGPDADHVECDLSKSPAIAPCSVSERYGVFVSPFASDAGANGTREAPYRNIQAAVAAASADHKRVYVCDDGTGYAGPISVGPSADGMAMFGGFECSGWTYDTTRRVKLTVSTSPALTISNLATGIVLENFEIVAGDGANSGESSIGVVVNESAGVVLRRVKVAAGKGKDGTDGTNGGGPSNTVALGGKEGKPGLEACSADPRGGIPVTATCDGLEPSTSGSGGNGSFNPSAGGDNGGNGFPTYAGGKGGTGEPVSGTWSCTTGGGQPGDNGPAGPSARGFGSLTASGWKGTDGADGSPGQPGQGGGGGGGAKAPNACASPDGGALSPTGASGGSGGSGGCGGRGGKGGTAGGSSIALISLGSDVTLESCELIANDAGKGGNGGQGQGGGTGGQGGIGGVGGGSPRSKAACDGGKGGQGGNGGDGGGGMGGHSIGVAYRGKAPTGIDPASVKVGTKGTGGKPGSGTGNGDDGIAAISQPFNTADGG
jgi:hypothetical protein